MHEVQHIIGVCGDNHSHLDLIDLVMIGTPVIVAISYALYRVRLVLGVVLDMVIEWVTNIF